MTSLTTPKIRIRLETPGTDELTEYLVQTDNRDMVAFDLTRSRKGWPSIEDANMLWINFLAHHALAKRGGVPISFDDFLARAVSVDPVDEDGNDIDPENPADGVSADPFQKTAEPTY